MAHSPLCHQPEDRQRCQYAEGDGREGSDRRGCHREGRLGHQCTVEVPPHAARRQVRNIVVCEACERFTWYGLRAILVLYLKEELDYSPTRAIALFS